LQTDNTDQNSVIGEEDGKSIEGGGASVSSLLGGEEEGEASSLSTWERKKMRNGGDYT